MSGNSTERFLRALYENAGDGALSVSYQVMGRSLTQSEYMVCATYRKKGKEVCPSHQIRNCALDEYSAPD